MSVSSESLMLLYSAFEKNPGDTAGYLAIADELRDLGYESLAHAFEWMGRRRRWPHKRERYAARGVPGRTVPATFRWAWYAEPHRTDLDRQISFAKPGGLVLTHSLPPLLLPGSQKVFATHQNAVDFLAAQLKVLGATYRATPPESPGLPLIEVFGLVRRDGTIIEPPEFEESS